MASSETVGEKNIVGDFELANLLLGVWRRYFWFARGQVYFRTQITLVDITQKRGMFGKTLWKCLVNFDKAVCDLMILSCL